MPTDRIIAINFEDYDFFELRDPAKLHGYIKDRLAEGEMTYVFLDEIQHVEDFPRVVDSLYIKKNTDLYLTGSNAYFLSSEIATLISGRYVEISMQPLSFYLELLRRGYDVYIGKVDGLAVDFVAMEQKNIIYYQVAASVRNDLTLKRELAPLQKIGDHYPKVILTLDEDPDADYNGIRRINALDWLMGIVES